MLFQVSINGKEGKQDNSTCPSVASTDAYDEQGFPLVDGEVCDGQSSMVVAELPAQKAPKASVDMQPVPRSSKRKQLSKLTSSPKDTLPLFNPKCAVCKDRAEVTAFVMLAEGKSRVHVVTAYFKKHARAYSKRANAMKELIASQGISKKEALVVVSKW